jgi:peroxiredoxin
MFDHERSLVQKYQGRPFALLGVDEDPSRETLHKTQKKYDLNWRSWWDKDQSIAAQWKAEALPTLFLIDHKGVVRWHDVGVPDLKQLDQRIEKLVKEAESEGSKQAALSRR